VALVLRGTLGFIACIYSIVTSKIKSKVISCLVLHFLCKGIAS